ncbi:52 kDa repressor of the inhibitor of the protein kinase-like isoform X2 [Sardina pilchardus]|uniref:52 kDa repressor of the inhibitor of the protein kinase-like isoform X2 n=1 Tax=Sardina pilchardus TaxID=27697 RepID=UPI002E14FC7B
MTEEKRNQTEQCSAINCENYQCDSKHLAFHRFPKDPHRCASWVENLGNASLMKISCKELRKSYNVCSAHFLPSQFKRPSDVHAGLKRDAVPTRANAPKRSSPLDTELQRKRPKQRQEMATKKRKQSHVVHPSNAGH